MNSIVGKLRVGFAVSCAVAFIALPARAQFQDDHVPRERTIPLREAITLEREHARKAGPLYVTPQFGVTNFGYNNNVFAAAEGERQGDYTATVFGGARFLVPFSTKVFLRGDALPEYTWYRKFDQLSQFGGRYDASLLALFNRLSLEAGGDTQKRVIPLSTEIERPVESRTNTGSAKAEIDLFSRLSVFGSGAKRTVRYDGLSGDAVQPEALDRDDSVARGGLRYRVSSFFDLSAAVEKTRSEFEVDRDRDNQTSAVIVGLFYDRPRTFVNLSVGNRKGESLHDSPFPDYSEITGSYYVTHELGAPIALEFYGNRAAINSVFLANPYFIETRNGLGLRFDVGRRLAVRTFGELGSNRYPVDVLAGDQIVRRTDDVSSIGGGVSVRLFRDLFLNVTAADTKYDSNLPGFDRSTFLLSTTLGFRSVPSR